MKKPKSFTLEDFRKMGPCYDPIKYLSENERYTAIDILKNTEIPFEDKLWAILRTEIISERTMRLFAVWSYRQTLNFVKNPDPRSIFCADIAEKFANGLSTKEELSAAEDSSMVSKVSSRDTSKRKINSNGDRRN